MRSFSSGAHSRQLARVRDRGVREAHLQHPGSRVGARGNGIHALVGLEVVHQLLRLVAGGAAVDGAAAPLEQQQLIERL